MVFVFRNVDELPVRDGPRRGEVMEFITQERNGRVRPVSVSDGTRVFDTLAAIAVPQRKPLLLRTWRLREPSFVRRGLRRWRPPESV